MTHEQPSLLPAIDPDALIAEVKAEHRPVRTIALFSGGGDSAVLAHRCRDHYDALAFLDTGTALPGVIAHVQTFAAWLGKPLEIARHEHDEYRRMVLGIGGNTSAPDWRPLGFPGPAQHGRAYNRLKERLIERVRSDAKNGHPRSARVLFLTGVRRAESQRRRARAPVTRKSAMVFANPLIDWPDSQMRAYRDAHDFPESEVTALLHRSGECNCGSFAAPGERAMIRDLWPGWFEDRIASLEREAEAAGIPACRWGERPPGPPLATDDESGPLCDSCVTRAGQLGLLG